MTFTAIGGEHVVANMFYIPLGIFLGAPNITVGKYIWKSMLPSTLGNIVGGGLFVGTLYWYLHLTGEESDQHQLAISHHGFAADITKGPSVVILENSPA